MSTRFDQRELGVAVYLKNPLLGFVLARRDGFDALTARGSALGKFTSERAAALALLELGPVE